MNSSLCYKVMPAILGALGFLFGLGCYLAEVYSPQNHAHFLYWSLFFTVQTASGAAIGWLIKRLYYTAFTDGLTGLWNYRFFYDNVTQQLNRAIPCSLIYLDLDNFKCINDRGGHPSGDEALRQLAGILRCSCRKTDLVARLGGDEFAILLPHTSLSDALLIAERIRESAETQFLPHNATISAGVTASWHEASADRLAALADRALYQAKVSKNQVVTLTSNDPYSPCAI